MNKPQPRILVSHSVKQHVHQLCYGLQEQGRLQKFITGVWYKPHHWLVGNLVKVLSNISPSFERQARKRYFEPLREDLVEIYPFPELTRLLLTRIFKPKHDFKWLFIAEIYFDRYVSRRIRKLNPDIFISYEQGSLESFKTARRLGKITILDLALVHHNRIIELRNQFDLLRYGILEGDAFFEKANRIKEERLQHVDYIFTLSEMAKETLLKAGIEEKRIFLLYLGFEPKNFTPRTHYPLTGPFRILYVGAIMESKGIALILEAVKRLQLPDVEVTLVGSITIDGSAMLKRYAGYFRHIPYVLHTELAKLYQECEVMAFPSYTDSWGMVVIEAMACGTPVLVADTCGAREVVWKGGGFVTPAGSVDALQEKLLYLYHNRSQVEVLGKQARQLVQHYTWENYRKQLAQAINTIYSQQS